MTLKEAKEMLSGAGIENAGFEAKLLFSHFSEYSDFELLDPELSSASAELSDAVKRRASREPLQYILGSVGFYREEYLVTPDCLIPRPDTEILVDCAARNIPEGKSFLDLCTGTGCVAISTLKNTKNTTALAVDISDGALAVAEKNARLNSVSDRITFQKADVLSEDIGGRFYALLSNPPYVTPKEYEKSEPEIFSEPKIAFIGGDDGLLFYREITERYKNKIEEGGFIAFEIGYLQGDALREIGKDNGFSVEIIKDYSNNDRVALLRKG